MKLSRPVRTTCVAAAILVVLATLAGSGKTAWAQPAPGGPEVSQHEFTYRASGTRYPYYLFTPRTWNPEARLPVILLIHGAGGRGADMMIFWKKFADDNGIILVAPTFPLDVKFEDEVPVLLPALMEEVKLAVRFDSKRVYIVGYSAGGYSTFAAAIGASTYFAAVSVFAGIITPDYDSTLKEAKRHTPIMLVIGDHDQFFKLDQTRRTRDVLVANGFPVKYVELEHQDHDYFAASADVNPRMWAFLSAYSLP